MSCVPYPQTRMYWSDGLRIPAISGTMSHDRFFKLPSHPQVAIDDLVLEEHQEFLEGEAFFGPHTYWLPLSSSSGMRLNRQADDPVYWALSIPAIHAAKAKSSGNKESWHPRIDSGLILMSIKVRRH